MRYEACTGRIHEDREGFKVTCLPMYLCGGKEAHFPLFMSFSLIILLL